MYTEKKVKILEEESCLEVQVIRDLRLESPSQWQMQKGPRWMNCELGIGKGAAAEGVAVFSRQRASHRALTSIKVKQTFNRSDLHIILTD